MSLHKIANVVWVVAAAGGVIAVTATTASGQTPASERVIVSAGFGQQSASPAFSTVRTSTIYAEQAQWSERYGGRISSAFDVAAAVRMWRQVWVEAAYAASSYRASVEVRGDVPHPFRFNTLRPIEGVHDGLERQESDLHLALVYRLNLVDRLSVSISVGPALITAAQDVVDSVTYDETYPYDTATFAEARVISASTSKVTVGVGADISYRVFGRISVGVTARHARAPATFETPSGHSVRTKIGGTDLTGGVRVGF